MIGRLICAFKGHDLVLEREGGDWPKAIDLGTAEESHVRICQRCGKVNARADILWTPALREALKPKRTPKIMIETTKSGTFQVIVTAMPLKRPGRPAEPLSQRRNRAGRAR